MKFQGHISLLDSQINVLLDTKAKTSSITEVPPQQLIFLHLQTTLQKLHCLLTPNSDIACNLFITPDTKGSHSVPCCQLAKNVVRITAKQHQEKYEI
jgi:hypothetical protein